jgi:hypothetical protein
MKINIYIYISIFMKINICIYISIFIETCIYIYICQRLSAMHRSIPEWPGRLNAEEPVTGYSDSLAGDETLTSTWCLLGTFRSLWSGELRRVSQTKRAQRLFYVNRAQFPSESRVFWRVFCDLSLETRSISLPTDIKQPFLRRILS